MKTVAEWACAVAADVASARVAGGMSLPLADFQVDAASRLVAIMERFGGALLADAVGMGKTRVALAVAAAVARKQRIAGLTGPVWLVVPARLRHTWASAAEAAGLHPVLLVTHTAMSRGRIPKEAPIAIVVDEAHRFRNPRTARYAVLRNSAQCPLLLATATPVVNSLDDLWAILELFVDDVDTRQVLGWDLATARALAARNEWEPLELFAAVAVRRQHAPAESSFGARQRVNLRMAEYDPAPQESWLWKNLEGAVRELGIASDWPQGLFVEYVMRRWESGPHALLETLQDLSAFANRRLEAARLGRQLDRSTFRDLFGANASQGVLEFLYPEAATHTTPTQMQVDAERIEVLVRRVEELCELGSGRDVVLTELAKDPAQLLIFTSYRAAAGGMYRHLVDTLGPRARVGLITGARSEATGLGRTPAHELLRRFSPRSHGASYREHERISVLVATDCIAEGVNLQDCGRIVLADLPASPLAVQQRVGRLLRPGGHEDVEVLLPRPRDWVDSLGMRRRLRSKLRTARDAGFADTVRQPFALLTTLQRLAARSQSQCGTLPGATRVSDVPDTWLVYARVGNLPWLFCLGAPVDLAATFVESSWDERQIIACDVPEPVSAKLDERRALLQAAHDAPPSIALDDPRALAWRILLEEVEPDGLEELRERLLSCHRRSVLRRLATRLCSPRDLLRFVQTLAAPAEPADVTLVSALGI